MRYRLAYILRTDSLIDWFYCERFLQCPSNFAKVHASAPGRRRQKKTKRIQQIWHRNGGSNWHLFWNTTRQEDAYGGIENNKHQRVQKGRRHGLVTLIFRRHRFRHHFSFVVAVGVIIIDMEHWQGNHIYCQSNNGVWILWSAEEREER